MSALVPKNVQRAGGAYRMTDLLPKIGEYFWVKMKHEKNHGSDEEKFYGFEFSSDEIKRRRNSKGYEEEALMCVEHVASNHVVLTAYEAYVYSGSKTQEWNVELSFEDFFKDCRPAPEWKEVITKRMDMVRLAMEAETRRLYNEAQKANALPPSNTAAAPTQDNPFALAVRTLDPAKEKASLIALQKRIPIVAKNVEYLAREQAALSKMLMAPELSNLYAMQKKLGIVEDKIFTLEVYAGLQEEVLQIRKGDPAAPDAKIAVRQSLLFMDEETLFDYDKGGMDFSKLEDFDEWVAKPENTDRILPEPRGVVAFRVRRNMKDYGPIQSLWQAFKIAAKHAANMETYLLLRNGDRLYRIASEVSFQPRLIPLRGEFDNAFVKEESNYNFDKHEHDVTRTDITPRDFKYDRHVEELRNHMKQYNRVVVLLQGLLDRSEVFHPHPPINLSEQGVIEAWLNLVRDEEDGLESGTLTETWEEYRDRCNATLEAGDWICHNYWDGRKRAGEQWTHKAGAPNIIQIKRRRKGTRRDMVPYRSEGHGQHHRVITEGRGESECVGIDGVEIEWQWEETVYPRERWRQSFDKTFTGHMWIPLTSVFNLMNYQRGDFRKFLCDRTQKGKYLKWATVLLPAETWRKKMDEA